MDVKLEHLTFLEAKVWLDKGYCIKNETWSGNTYIKWEREKCNGNLFFCMITEGSTAISYLPVSLEKLLSYKDSWKILE